MSSKESEKYPRIQLRLTHHEAKLLSELKEKFGLTFRKILQISSACDCQDPVITTYKNKQVIIPRNILSKKL